MRRSHASGIDRLMEEDSKVQVRVRGKNNQYATHEGSVQLSPQEEKAIKERNDAMKKSNARLRQL